MADLKHTCPVNCAVTGEPIATPCLACDAERGVCLLPKWIPCSERMPDPMAWALVAYDGDVVVAHWGGGDHWWRDAVDADDSVRTHEVTHWMPLPEPPK